MAAPDFDALRAERNAAVQKIIEAVAKEQGWPVSEVKTSFNPDACYCDCAGGGPCEHKWDGPIFRDEDDCMRSTTCSRCGLTSFSHDIRL